MTDVTGTPFRRLLASGQATLDDWQLHLTTLFPEVRLKGYIELRSADSQPRERLLALPALVKGIFYDADCLEAAHDLVKRWSFEDTAALYHEVVRGALAARRGRVAVLESARELLAIAREGLRRQHALDERGEDERTYLVCLEEELAAGRTPADLVAEAWAREWDPERRVERLIASTAYRP